MLPAPSASSAETQINLPSPPAPLPHLLNLLPDPLWVFDRRDQISQWNKAASQLFGLPPEEAIGQSVLIFVPHEDQSRFLQACEAVRRCGRWDGNLRLQTATNEPRLVEARWVMTGPQDEASTAVLATFTDVTERRALERRERQSARWDAIRDLLTAIAAETRSRDEWAAQIRRFARGPEPVAASSECRGNDDTVLVATAAPVLRELVRALLEAAGYRPLLALDRFEAVRFLADRERTVRVAVLAFGDANSAVAAELRRNQPVLPIVALGSPAPSSEESTIHLPVPTNPLSVLRAVAMSVASDRLTEVSLQVPNV